MSNNTGGPAFPATQYDNGIGMTLRDYFAAKAMQGFAARDVFDNGLATPYQRANLAYIEADAMLKARDK
jgi:hypothetical protein